eukprot:GGOE01001508.1.p1 GENE.GGOE01001508.1~~GGOE01001508.1.p1  ORF type:complete len:324 (-),score=106.43 GGOE01001508.1:262-1194(-)
MADGAGLPLLPKPSPLSSPSQEPFRWLRMEDLKGASSHLECRIAIALVCFYYLSAILFYSCYAGWGVLDSLYFATVTFTTVGYGDVVPKTSVEKVFTCFFALLAVAIIATALGILMERVVDVEAAKVSAIGFADGDSAWMSIARALGHIFVILVVGGAVYSLLERQDFESSLYWSCVTVTTIGYGDVVPKSSLGKQFAIIFMIIGTFYFAKVLSALVQFPLDLRRQRMEEWVQRQLGDDLQRGELRALLAEVRNLGLVPESQDWCGRAEFALAMLVSLGKVQEDDIRRALQEFDRLDVEKDRKLDIRDVR